MNLPELPIHPEPWAFKWSELEVKTIKAYGQACRDEALEEAAQACSHKAETKRLFLNEAHYLECAEAIRSLKS